MKTLQLWNFWLLMCLFFNTLLGYSWITLPPKPSVRKSLPFILGVLGSIFTFFKVEWNVYSITCILLMGFFTLGYNTPFLQWKFRSFPGLKIFIISLVWSMGAVLLPFLNEGKCIYSTSIFLFASMFFWTLGITIPFDIRDSEQDDIRLQTLPQMFGINSSKTISITSLLLSYSFYTFTTNDWLYLCAMALAVGIACLGSILANTRRNAWYFGFFIESTSALPMLFLILLEFLFN